MKTGKGDTAAQRQRREARTRAAVRAIKDVPCADCNQRYPYYVMDFDHVPERGEKKFHINKKPHIALATLLAEIDKCDVVCANCHRIRTHQRSLG